MATYAELVGIIQDTTAPSKLFRDRVKMATIVAADKIQTEARRVNSPQRLLWARAVLSNPDAYASQMVTAVLAQYRTQTIEEIHAATDAVLQTGVDNQVDGILP